MADFTREEVIQVVLDGRKCKGADLRGINLCDADLRGIDLTGANLRGARYNANTKWPEGVDPVAKGAVMVEDDD